MYQGGCEISSGCLYPSSFSTSQYKLNLSVIGGESGHVIHSWLVVGGSCSQVSVQLTCEWSRAQHLFVAMICARGSIHTCRCSANSVYSNSWRFPQPTAASGRDKVGCAAATQCGTHGTETRYVRNFVTTVLNLTYETEF